MKKGFIVLIVLLIAAFGIYEWAVGFNNKAVENEANAKTAWSNVESSYQRRNDLIGNLVKTVQGAADFERGTLTDVIEARAKATATSIDANNLTPEKMAAFQEAQSGLTGALSKLMVVVERYPGLKANQNFLDLQTQLEGTENRINVARQRYNQAVEAFNSAIRKFPASLTNSLLLHLDRKEYFKADEQAKGVPAVKF